MLALLLTAALAAPAFAITEADVEAQVSATSREAVTGNVLIWFLCAIAFLKISQKIDSFMASLGVNVGHTGGSMLAEAMIATRSVTTVAGLFGGGGRHSGGGASGGSSGALGGFLKGGLAGVVSRKVTNDAVKTATTSTSAVSTVKSTAAASQSSTVRERQADVSRQTDTRTGTHQSTQTEAVHSASAQTITRTAQQSEQSASQVFHQTEQTVSQAAHSSEQSVLQNRQQSEQSVTQSSQQSEHTTQTTTHASHTTSTVTQPDGRASAPAFKGVGLGGAIFAKSLRSGGSFANDVIGTVAKGDIRSTGSITGDLAAQSIQSYLGYGGDGAGSQTPLTFSNVEIGGGRITGTVSKPGMSEPLSFGMYHSEQYTEPRGDFAKIRSADGALWYTQLAQDAVERKPYKAPDGTVAYNESIVKRLPDPPKRKDRI